ncbi:MAG: tRNA (adenosine(37)-N6)-threonylcarbamoyltransferase complex dimerization subunit type 1 TsaB [Gammaproteobacteria bacterium]|nr:tRNA (adenosine(37)-N6)-threonylcarbamoyltransferase complex dimerization subunit type 1 TsaB [Gammaproteobacteria bacterium]
MRILALETASDACSAALWHDGAVYQRLEVAPRRHGELILVMAEAVMEEAGCRRGDLDLVAFGRGPGSFTGLRIAAGVAQGIAFARDLPVAPVSSLQALAQGALRERGRRRVLAAFDARMAEVYWGGYDAGAGDTMALVGEEVVCPPAAVPVPAEGAWHGVGSGWKTYGAELAGVLGPRLSSVEGGRHPEARDVAELAVAMAAAGTTVAAEAALPVYLRNQVATPRT